MSWYKKAKGYDEIGHSTIDKVVDHILWYSPDGTQVVKSKKNESLSHSQWYTEDEIITPRYSGRYDVGKRELSVSGYGWFETPKALINNLIIAFPNVKIIHIFGTEPQTLRVANRKTAQLRGEWWIIDGKSVFADSETGEMGHEGYVIDAVRRKYAYDEFDKGEWIDWEAFKRRLAMEAYAEKFGENLPGVEWEKFSKSLIKPEQYYLPKLKEMGMTDEEYLIAEEKGDARQYGMEYLGWKRIAGNNIQTQTLTHDDLKFIASGLDDAYGEDIEDNTIFNIEVNGNGRYYQDVPYYLISDEAPSQLEAYNTSYQYAQKEIMLMKKTAQELSFVEIIGLENIVDKIISGNDDWTEEELQLHRNNAELVELMLKNEYEKSQKGNPRKKSEVFNLNQYKMANKTIS